MKKYRITFKAGMLPPQTIDILADSEPEATFILGMEISNIIPIPMPVSFVSVTEVVKKEN